MVEQRVTGIRRGGPYVPCKAHLMSGTCLFPRETYTISVQDSCLLPPRPLRLSIESSGLQRFPSSATSSSFEAFFIRLKGMDESEKINKRAGNKD